MNFIFMCAESRQGLAVDGRAAVSAKPDPSTDPLALPSVLDLGEAGQESYQVTQRKSRFKGKQNECNCSINSYQFMTHFFFTQTNGNARLPNPEHFPFLSRRLAAMESFDDEIREQSRSSTPLTSFDMPQNFSTNGMQVFQTTGSGSTNNNNSIIINGNLPNSELFARELNAETIDDVNAATAMLALKHGPKIFTEGIQFVQSSSPPTLTTTSSPSEDHTYSAYGKNGTSDNNSNGTSSDAAYESSEEKLVD
jgi:hypothetical protein